MADLKEERVYTKFHFEVGDGGDGTETLEFESSFLRADSGNNTCFSVMFQV
jgi:hypothetical protein